MAKYQGGRTTQTEVDESGAYRTTGTTGPAVSSGGGGHSSGQSSSRTIVTLMAIATGVALVAKEAAPTTVAKGAATGGVVSTVDGAKIILGFTIGTVSLILLSHAGEPVAKFAVGLAGIAMAGSLLANGDVLAKIITNLTSSTKATPSTTATATTAATHPVATVTTATKTPAKAS